MPEHLKLLSAALRHLRDAEHLADAANPRSSLDQAYHLAGFGPECARKAAIAEQCVDKLLGHHLGAEADAALDLALILTPAAARYELQGWDKAYPALARWHPECRYEKTGERERHDVERLLVEARRVVDEILAALWADGRLPLDSFQ